MMPMLFAEGTAWNKLQNVDQNDILEYCYDKKGEKDGRLGKYRKHADNAFYGMFFDFARNFDHLQDNVLNQRMCTSVCPCLDYGENPSTAEMYKNINPVYLAKHNRTFD